MQKLRVIPLGGLGEIGKNMMVIEYGNNAIIIDAGLMFPESDMLGVDYIIPDMRYLLDNRDRLNIHGIFITHGHEDHTGAIHHLLDVVDAPIFATPLTAGLLEVKLRQNKRTTGKLTTFKAGEVIKRGPFEMQSFHVCHSIPDCVGFGIKTPVGLIVHTGDFKFDQTPVDGWTTDFARLASFAEQGVLALFSDSTNADRPGWTPSERLIDEGFDRTFRRAKGRIFVATFASLISRVEQVTRACMNYDRKMAIAGTSMSENVAMAQKLGYLSLPEDLIVPLDRALRMPKDKVVFMVTGSQGEPTAVLSRLSQKRHNTLDILSGDTIIMSSHAIPGNEVMVQRTINRLFQQGAEVIYDAVEQVHVSGHASQEEMKLMLSMVRPKYFIPVHGELRHLHSHARLAQNMGIPRENCAVVENGTILEFSKDNMKIGERYPGGYVFVDGAGVGDIGPAVIRDREILANEGFVIIILAINQYGELMEQPGIISRGFVFLRESEELFEMIRGTVRRVVGKSRNGRRHEEVEEAVSKLIFQETRRRPMIFTHIHEVVAD
ncbi:MAG: ribonuclease J [Anaerolineae bacterium]|nr:ribonuclease J [Anaerolineae bacterium]